MYLKGKFLKKGIRLDNNKDNYTLKNMFVDFLNWINNNNDFEFKSLEIIEHSCHDTSLFSILKYTR